MAFCAANQLVIGGTLFKPRDIYICISRRFRTFLVDVKACRGADIGSDHYLGRGRLKIKLQSLIKIIANRRDVPAIDRLRNLTKVEEYNYNVALQNRL